MTVEPEATSFTGSNILSKETERSFIDYRDFKTNPDLSGFRKQYWSK